MSVLGLIIVSLLGGAGTAYFLWLCVNFWHDQGMLDDDKPCPACNGTFMEDEQFYCPVCGRST